MRIAVLIAEGMMLAVVGHPEECRSLSRHSTQPGKEQSHRPPCRETAVREESVIAQADAQTSGHPVQGQTDCQARPGEKEGGGKGRKMHAYDPDEHRPVDARHRADAILPRFGGEAASSRPAIAMPGIVDRHTPKIQTVSLSMQFRSCNEFRSSVVVTRRFATRLTVVDFVVLGAGYGRHRFLS